MFFSLGFIWRTKHFYPMPIVEFSTSVDKQLAIEEILLQVALDMIEKVEKYGGSIVEPLGSIPKDKNIVFTARFKSNKDFEDLKKALGKETMG